MKFYLGTQPPNWLAKTDVPLFISRRTLYKRKSFPRAIGRWALDSGGFTELNKAGRWSVECAQYADEVRLFMSEIGGMDWAAPQDWMCEPWILKKTGLTVDDHQALTIQSVQDLRRTAPEVPWTPVLQGWTLEDYMRHIDRYLRSGIDLRSEPIVGLGSVCRRQATKEAAEIVSNLASTGLRLHGFGFKIKGLEKVAHRLVSSDSLAWSYGARKLRRAFFPECAPVHKSCANCIRYAMWWRDALVKKLDQRLASDKAQGRLFS